MDKSLDKVQNEVIIMAGKDVCGDCPQWVAWVVLIVGILWLLQDYGVALGFWRVGPWTAVFVLLGLSWVAKSKK